MDTDHSNENLINRARFGEQAALQRLLLRHHERLARAVGRMLPPDLRASVSAEDVLQEAYAVAFKEISGFEPRGPDSFYYWLLTLAEFRLLNVVKSARAAKRGGDWTRIPPANFEVASADRLIDALRADEHTPSRSIAGHEARAAVLGGLTELPRSYQEALRFRYLEALSVEETARRMGCTDRAVQMLCYRGLRKLRAALGRSSRYLSKKL